MAENSTTVPEALKHDLSLIRTALNWCGCVDDRYAEVMESAGDVAREALERIEERLGVQTDAE